MRRGPLGSRSFRWVWSGETVSMLGDASYEVTFAWLVLSVTGSPAALGAVLLATTVPRGLLLLVGGAITDRLSPRLIMLGAHLVRAIAISALTMLYATTTLHAWHLYGIGVAVGVAEAFFAPASGSILPSLVGTEDLPRANALLGAAEQTSRMLGPILGGILMAWAGTPTALGFNALTFAAAAGTVLAAPRHKRTPTEALSVGAVLREIRSGLSYTRHSVEVRIVLLLMTAATLSYSGMFAVGLPALATHFDHGPLVLGAMLSGWGLGQLLGTLSATVTGLPHRWGLLIIGMALAEGTSFALLGIAAHYQLAVALLTLLGFGVAYSNDVALPTFIHTRTPAPMLGRVNSVIELPRAMLAPVSIAGMGLLATIDIRWACTIAALPMLLAGLGLATNPQARQLHTHPPPHSAT